MVSAAPKVLADFDALHGFAGQVGGASREVSGGAEALACPEATRAPAVDAAVAEVARGLTFQLQLIAEVLQLVARVADGAAEAFAALDDEAAGEVPRKGGPQ